MGVYDRIVELRERQRNDTANHSKARGEKADSLDDGDEALHVGKLLIFNFLQILVLRGLSG